MSSWVLLGLFLVAIALEIYGVLTIRRYREKKVRDNRGTYGSRGSLDALTVISWIRSCETRKQVAAINEEFIYSFDYFELTSIRDAKWLKLKELNDKQIKKLEDE